MNSVVQLCRELKNRPHPLLAEGVALRTFAGRADIAAWLAVREQAFAREKLGVRRWDARDFEQEFLLKSWWRPDRLWIAEAAGEPVGTVAMALRGTGAHAVPAVHWLAVVPAWRRRGVGRLLTETLEAAAWDAGHRTVWLETHAKWERALAFYRALGYVPSGAAP